MIDQTCETCGGAGGGWTNTSDDDWEWIGCDACQNTGYIPVNEVPT